MFIQILLINHTFAKPYIMSDAVHEYIVVLKYSNIEYRVNAFSKYVVSIQHTK